MDQRTKNRICLFIRVSSQAQEYDRQILELKNYCSNNGYVIVKTIATKITGSKTREERPDLIELLTSAKKGLYDKVLVTEISRIGRNAKDIRSTIDQLHSNRVGVIFKNLSLESLDEKGEETFVTNIIISIYAEMAQEEKKILVSRIKSGIESAKANGKRIGRPLGAEDKTTLLKKYHRLVVDLKAGLSLRKAMKIHEISKSTVIKVKRII